MVNLECIDQHLSAFISICDNFNCHLHSVVLDIQKILNNLHMCSYKNLYQSMWLDEGWNVILRSHGSPLSLLPIVLSKLESCYKSRRIWYIVICIFKKTKVFLSLYQHILNDNLRVQQMLVLPVSTEQDDDHNDVGRE